MRRHWGILSRWSIVWASDLLSLIEQIWVLWDHRRRCYARVCNRQTGLLQRIALDLQVDIWCVLGESLLLEAIQLDRDELNCLSQILAAIVHFTLHLTAASEIVADNCLVRNHKVPEVHFLKKHPHLDIYLDEGKRKINLLTNPTLVGHASKIY